MRTRRSKERQVVIACNDGMYAVMPADRTLPAIICCGRHIQQQVDLVLQTEKAAIVKRIHRGDSAALDAGSDSEDGLEGVNA